jgi:hypothetical protein
MSVSMLTLLGNRALSFGAPQGKTCDDVSRSIVGGTESSEKSKNNNSFKYFFSRPQLRCGTRLERGGANEHYTQ